MVRSGEVALEINGTTLERLGPGACFGELALLTGSTQQTSVIALCETQVLVIDEPLFRGVLKANPKIADEISKILAERQAELADASDSGPPSRLEVKNWSDEFLVKIRDIFGLA
jgi:trk system potassium uptake protein TrkA